MKYRRLLLLAVVLGAALLGFSSVFAAPAPAAPTATDSSTGGAAVDVTFLHLNDPHGTLELYDDKGKSFGGYARLATAIRSVRAEAGIARVFLVDAGDDFSTKVKGDPVPRVAKGAGTVAIMNHLKFDVWTPGNHEFDSGLDAFKARMSESTASILTTNLLVKATGQPLGKPFVIEKAGPVRVAFVGLCVLLPPQPQQLTMLQLDDPAATLKKVLPDLRKQADAVIVVSHLGIQADKQLAQTVEGIDLIIGAHSHTVIQKGERVKDPTGKEVLIVQAGIQMHYLGRVNLKFVPADGGYCIADAQASLITIDGSVKSDPAVASLVEKAVKESPPPPPSLAPAAKSSAPASTAKPTPQPAAVP